MICSRTASSPLSSIRPPTSFAQDHPDQDGHCNHASPLDPSPCHHLQNTLPLHPPPRHWPCLRHPSSSSCSFNHCKIREILRSLWLIHLPFLHSTKFIPPYDKSTLCSSRSGRCEACLAEYTGCTKRSSECWLELETGGAECSCQLVGCKMYGFFRF